MSVGLVDDLRDENFDRQPTTFLGCSSTCDLNLN